LTSIRGTGDCAIWVKTRPSLTSVPMPSEAQAILPSRLT
jgi:hypothetical protein